VRAPRANGHFVSIPFGHSPDCGLVADDGETPMRVQVKTSIRHRRGRREVALCTRGANPKYARYEVEPGRPLPSAASS
jgi:hypothetical protein